MQQQQVGLEQKAFGESEQAFTPALSYWKALLQGGQPARVAVGPIAGDISANAQAQREQIANTLPAGGERNLAIAKGYVQQASDTARLYAGVQPAAATALGNLASFRGGQSVGFGGTAGVSPYSASSIYQNSINQSNQAATGFGNLLYTAFQKSQNRPSGGGGVPAFGLDQGNAMGVTSPASTSTLPVGFGVSG